MGLLDVLKQWSTFPVIEETTYQCRNCGSVLDDAATACPECGGELAEQSHESIELYWPHH